MAEYFRVEVDPEEEIADQPTPGSPTEPEDDEPEDNDPEGQSELSEWPRELTAAEKRVDLVEIQNFLKTSQQQFQNAIKPSHDNLRREALNQATSSRNYNPKFSARAKKAFEDKEAELKFGYYERGSREALREIKAQSNGRMRRARGVFETEARKITAKLQTDLKTAVEKAIAKAELDAKLISREEIKKATVTAIAGVFDRNLGALASVAVSTGFAKGREDAFASNRSKISRYQWSSVLIPTTDATCGELDGKVVEDWREQSWQPPIHPGCYCMWVAILADEVDPPEITGLPQSPGGMRRQPLQPL